MALKVIGAGWGRTGTESLKLALEQLGFDKCYHAYELLNNPEQTIYWEQLQRGEKTDYDALFEGYQAAVDYPVCYHYRQLMEQYPDAKVILTVRNPAHWYSSAAKTIFVKPEPAKVRLLWFLGLFSKRLGYIYRITKNAQSFLFGHVWKNQTSDKAAMMEFFNSWNEEVIRTVPPDRLLVYEVKQGWEPLCNFLNVPVPYTPFPKANDHINFHQRLDERVVKGKKKKANPLSEI
jgi:hypothetical protein